ncbi:tripartite motif-containing protein 16-like [Gadus macrocephalus]|uniref:tripartite motif-containing protein 16-like n=1 Tax=Gadus macrocephalus TaxID=80720 RepID=UPI0028CB4F3D|nr:tripartite motif-containing protein 16-like [Gadus macrocephalus]
MAALTSISIEEDQFSCPVCLDFLRDPVTIPCGHSYCLDCIDDYWTRNKNKGYFGCPQCRQLFNPRPALSRNTVLSEVVDQIHASNIRTDRQHSLKAEQVVLCGVCSGSRKREAVKSCLACLESYCVAHLGVHDDQFRGNAHKLTTPLARVRDKLCRHHDKVLREYCWTDQQCVCAQCVRHKHRGHDTVPLAEARATHERKLADASFKSLQKCKEIKKELKYIVNYIKHSTQAVMDESERTFSKLARLIEKHRSEVRKLIRSQEQTVLQETDELLGKLERESKELKRRGAELEELSNTDDHLQFLQKCKSFHFPAETVDLPSTDVLPYRMYKSMRGALVELRAALAEVCENELLRVSDKVGSLKKAYKKSIEIENVEGKEVVPLHSAELKTREDFLQYYHDLSLDSSTANPYLILSDGRRGVTTWSEAQPYPENPGRFTRWAQVLCRAGMAGRCYWEVEWSGVGGVSVGLCYKSMAREGAGSDCKLGHNSKSWSLDCSPSACSFQHDKDTVAIAVPCANRIGVYMDYRAGILSFYSIPDGMILLHTVRTTFTQPLYPGFWVGLGSTLRLCPFKWL